MFEQLTNSMFLVTALVLHLVSSSPQADEQPPLADELAAAEANHQLVVRNMREDFRSFGIGVQQAQMLAEQTADFGTKGMLTTMAAVGFGPLLANVIVVRAKRRTFTA
jgi:hypothetical protein